MEMQLTYRILLSSDFPSFYLTNSNIIFNTIKHIAGRRKLVEIS